MKRAILLALCTILAGIGLAVFALVPGEVSQGAIDAAIDRSSPRIEAAWQLPAASRYGREVVWQSNGSLCGPASLVNVFRSLGEGAATEAEVLAGTGFCRTGYCLLGLTLDELATVARAGTRRNVTVLRGLSLAEFREHLRRANEAERRYVINFTRARIFGAGVGHFSPIGGYLPEHDLVFVLDVNPSFRPWLIGSARLHAAMDTFDGDRKRGLLLIE